MSPLSESPSPCIELTALPTHPLPTRPAALSRSSTFELSRQSSKQSVFDDSPQLPHLTSSHVRDSSPMRRFTAGGNTGERAAELGAAELHPVDRGKHAMLFVAAAFVLETTIWGYSFTFGIVQVYLHSNPPFNQYSLEAISAVGTVSLACQYILPVLVIIGFQRYPDWARTALSVAAIVSCASMLLASWATKVWQLILLQGVLGGVTGAVLYAPVLLWMNQWFVERRGFASGIVFAGTGVGGFCFPFFIGALLDKLGFPWMCRIWALFTAVAFGGSLLVLKPRLPVVRPTRGESRGRWIPLDMSFVYNPLVLIMCATTFISSLSFFPISLYLPNFVESLPSATSLSSNTVLALFNAASVLGSTVIGYLSDRYSYAAIVGAIGVGSSITAFLSFGFAHTLGQTFLFAVLYGTFSGICSAWSAVARDVAGSNSQMASMIFCCFGIWRGVASVTGPLIAATLYHPPTDTSTDNAKWGRYGFAGVIIFCGVMAMLSSVGAAGLGAVKRFKKE